MKLNVEYKKLSELIPYANNAKEHPQEQIEQIIESIEQFGMNDPIAVDKHNVIIEGHGRYEACKQMGIDEVPVISLDHLTDEQRKAYTLVHNQLTMNSGFDFEMLKAELEELSDFDMEYFGFDFEELEQEIENDTDNADGKYKDSQTGSVAERFVIAPFSILNTRSGEWQNRKKAWIEQGIDSGEGRDEALLGGWYGLAKNGKGHTEMTGTSIFDPVLCEIMYKWFNIQGGKIYDCFSGGSVRGIVASKLGYEYHGIDLRQEQIDANRKQANRINEQGATWYCDDSQNVDNYIEDESMDMVFSCPPYADLEVYSNDERDISNMEYDDFKVVYKNIIDKACNKLKNERFAVFVVGDVRDKNGVYRRFVDYTKDCFEDNGLHLINEFILVNMVGTGSLRVTRQFNTTRKAVKVHQNVLVYYKGNYSNIKENFGEVVNDEDFLKFEDGEE